MKTILVVVVASLGLVACSARPEHAKADLQKNADADCVKHLGPGAHAVGVDEQFPHGSACREASSETLEDPSQPRTATLAQQKMCSDQAQKQFKESGFKMEVGTVYASHYDARANICYELVSSMSSSNGIPATTKTVFDAFEGREYATYAWANATKKKYWEIAPMMCVVKPRGQAQIECKSSEEFD